MRRSRWFFQEDTAAGTGKPDKDNPQPLCREDDDVIEKMYKEGRNEEERIMKWGGLGGYKAVWGEGKEGEVRKEERGEIRKVEGRTKCTDPPPPPRTSTPELHQA